MIGRIKTAAFALTLAVLMGVPAQAVTYGIDFDTDGIDITGTITTNGTLGTFNGRSAFFAIVNTIDLTVSDASTSVNYDQIVTSDGGDRLNFEVTETAIVLTSTAGVTGPNAQILNSDFSTTAASDSAGLLQFTSGGELRFGGGRGTTQTGVTNLTFTVIPLPATVPLFAAALGGLALMGWRRRRSTRLN